MTKRITIALMGLDTQGFITPNINVLSKKKTLLLFFHGDTDKGPRGVEIKTFKDILGLYKNPKANLGYKTYIASMTPEIMGSYEIKLIDCGARETVLKDVLAKTPYDYVFIWGNKNLGLFNVNILKCADFIFTGQGNNRLAETLNELFKNKG